jgi:ribosome-binding protein aMBF1 (putative translation factor)
MAKCSKCGAEDNEVRLFDAISNEGIIKICEKCASEEGIPVIKKTYEFEKKPALKNQESNLRKIVDSRVVANESRREFADLIDNFHWIIMRARRIKHMTQEQLGKEIGESEKIIKSAEKGFLPADYRDFIKKIEDILSIRLFNKEARKRIEEQDKKLGFDSLTTRSLTISDLQEMKNKKERGILEESEFNKEAEKNENNPEFIQRNTEKNKKSKGDLSQKDIDKIIFGK